MKNFILIKVYQRYIKGRIFNKILITYACITIIVLSLFGFILSRNFGTILEENELRYIGLTIDNVNNYLDKKNDSFRRLLVQLYMNKFINTRAFLQDDPEKPNYDIKKSFYDDMESILSRDVDIQEVTMYRKNDKGFYLFTKDTDWKYEENEVDFYGWKDLLDLQNTSTIVTPSQVCFYDKRTRVFRISSNVKKLNSIQNLGVVILGFRDKGLETEISRFMKPVNGTFLILKEGGKVIYDSSLKYYDSKYPWMDALENTKALYSYKEHGIKTGNIKINNEDFYVFKSKENNLKLTVVGLIPKNEILRHSKAVGETTATAVFLSLILLLLVIFFSTGILSKRVHILTTAMKKLRNGDLSIRIPIRKETDELAEIATSFNKMCDSLNEYIDKEYLYELKQKNAEFKFLQAQINPHFLYNTLEAIRMKSIAENDSEAAQMIYKMASLLRITVKKETVIQVSEEIYYCQVYIDLFKVRYGEKLKCNFNIDKEVLKFGMPRHILQPILENSLIHGYDASKTVNTLHVTGYCSGEELYFTIADDGIGMNYETLELVKGKMVSGKEESKEGGSIGLANVNDRIRIIYGKECGIFIESDLGSGTRVTIKIKALSLEEVKNHVQSIDR